MNILLLDSGILQYFFFLFFLNIIFGLITAMIGFIGFIFLLISLIILVGVGYLFGYEKRITHEDFYVSPADGKIININNNIEKLPDIIENSAVYNNLTPYSFLTIESNIQNNFFKTSPCDGVIENITIIPPKTINKNSNFVHKTHKVYIILNITFEEENKKKNLFLIFEVLYLDKDYDLYKIYVEKNQKIQKGDILICVHFYSKIYMYIPTNAIKNSLNQSLFYSETSIKYE
jgi:hypothetical protein